MTTSNHHATSRSNSPLRSWLFAALALAPTELGVLGCDTAIVGDDSNLGGKPGTIIANGGAPAAGTTAGGALAIGGNTSFSLGGSATTTSGSNPVGSQCGGLLGASCGPQQYCKFDVTAQCGAADQTGICTAKPQACTMEYAPVCGCDDKTYGNACSAAAAGVSVALSGECPSQVTPGATCGGIAGAACPKGQFCSYPVEAKCGAADQTGTCTTVPQFCTEQYQPVCGCDGKTYGNACAAAGASMSYAAVGECATQPTPGTMCGGIAGKACGKGEYCNFPMDAQCGAADQTGTCAPIPQGCTKEYVPVCGCNGITYGNACMAAAAGVAVASSGACPTQPGATCGGLRGAQCATGEFCNFSLEAACGATDRTGTCTAIPQACDMMYAPVCGCDAKTYSNSCTANAAGVSVQANGACKT